MQAGMEISRDDIFETIGEQQVEIRVLRKRLMEAQEQLQELAVVKAQFKKLKEKYEGDQ
jgi:hypothetical protein